MSSDTSQPTAFSCTLQMSQFKEDRKVILPFELEREILELVAHSSRHLALELCTISKYVQEWMEAVIYRTIVLEQPITTCDLFLRTFNSRPPSFFAKNVKRLYICNTIGFDQTQKIIEACSGATEVTCWIYPHTVKDNLRQQLSPRNLQRLSITLEALWGLSPSSFDLGPRIFSPRFLPNLTHLEIVNPPGRLGPNLQIDWDGLATLPSLTHFALGELTFTSHSHFTTSLTQLLNECRKLQVMVIITRDKWVKEKLHETGTDSDHRVVVQSEFHGTTTLYEYWQELKNETSNFWTAADRTVTLRKNPVRSVNPI